MCRCILWVNHFWIETGDTCLQSVAELLPKLLHPVKVQIKHVPKYQNIAWVKKGEKSPDIHMDSWWCTNSMLRPRRVGFIFVRYNLRSVVGDSILLLTLNNPDHRIFRFSCGTFHTSTPNVQRKGQRWNRWITTFRIPEKAPNRIREYSALRINPRNI